MLETKVLNSLKALGEDFLCEIISIYLRDLSGFVTRIEKAVSIKDAAEGSIAAHSLRGASYSLGAKSVGDICYTFERAFDDEEFDGLPPLLPKLKKEVEMTQSELDHLHQKLTRSMEAYSEK
ncbi:MAG: Hpt domain-containing protein [Anaerolineaceae bacterium]|nr:Hpt domain-containing protein [Anaerolineaceae bacterium]